MALSLKKKTNVPKSGAGSVMAGVRNTILFVLLIAFFIVTVVIFNQVFKSGEYRRQYVSLTDELRLLSQQIPALAREAANGNADAFTQLGERVNAFNLDLKVLREGNPTTGLPPTPEDVLGQLEAVDTPWERVKENAELVIGSAEDILSILEIAEGFQLAGPELQALMDEVLGLMVEANEPPRQIYFAALQLTYAERMTGRLSEALRGGIGSASAAAEFSQWTKTFRHTLNNMRGEDQGESVVAVRDEAARALLEEVDTVFTAQERNVDAISRAIPRFFQIREAASVIFADSSELLATLDELIATYEERGEAGLFTTQNGFLTAGAGVAILMFLGMVLLLDSRKRAQDAVRRETEAALVTKMQNESVLQLLDEIEPLQDGDLTVEASVDEAFTGTIADAINSSIETLRNLVSTINAASSQVSQAAQDTANTTRELANASEQQARDIVTATDEITRMATEMEDVSKEAGRSADVAKNSVNIAHRGSETVRGTIDGMDRIREQIQETSKRLKRLGESSQEIGEIVGLINDIADQTNILALNAAIQASTAGEAGRGFAVVADEVQRLAERSTNATKQIENLVSAIQADTNEAVISMEQTTAQVVEGAKQAENAGEALDEIEKVSTLLAKLIDGISRTAREHAENAAKISGAMNTIENVTRQTSAGTSQTAESIGNLAQMAEKLKGQVSGFRLPD